MTIPICRDEVPYLSVEQMIEVDRAVVEDFGIGLAQMMENAGRNLAHLARVRFLDGDPRGKRFVVMAGTGGNGGGALVCARRLLNWGAQVRVLATRPDEYFAPVPAHQLRILRRMQVEVQSSPAKDREQSPDLIVDGIVGYSLRGAPRDAAGSLVRWANAQGSPLLALTAPPGSRPPAARSSSPRCRRQRP